MAFRVVSGWSHAPAPRTRHDDRPVGGQPSPRDPRRARGLLGRAPVGAAPARGRARARGGRAQRAACGCPRGATCRRSAAWGLTGMAAYQVLLNSGERTVPAGTASLIVNVSPVIVALVATTLLGERLTRAGWAGHRDRGRRRDDHRADRRGRCGSSAPARCWCSAPRSSRPRTSSAPSRCWARYDALELTAWAMALGALITLPLAPGLPGAIAHAPLGSSAAVALLALGASAVGFVAWAYALPAHRRLDRGGDAVRRPADRHPRSAGRGSASCRGISALAGGAVALAGVALVTRRQRG